jgi:hypothetical protein
MKPLRVINAALVAALLVAAGITYDLKYRAEAAAQNITHIQSDIAGEKDKIRTLNAEWATLNQPSRLEAVVNEHADYFQLQTFTPDQIGSIDDIPMRGSTPTATAAGAAATPSTSKDDAVKATLARIAAGGALRAR